MATTTNFGWETPDDTDLVKDGAAAMRTLGNSIDTSFVDLKGGTTGQVLSKASGTDLDFTWVAQDDSNAIQNTIVDAKGDLIAATAADTPARLAVGTNGQVLTADSTAATGLAWTTSTSGGMTLLNSGGTSLSGTTTTVSPISGSYNDLVIYLKDWYASSDFNCLFQVNGDTTASNYQSWGAGSYAGNNVATYGDASTQGVSVDYVGSSQGANNDNFAVIYIPNYANATTKKIITINSLYVRNTSSQRAATNSVTNYLGTTAAITSIAFKTTVGTWSGGSIEVYGVK